MEIKMLLSGLFAFFSPIGLVLVERYIKNKGRIVTFAIYILTIFCLTILREPSSGGRQNNLDLFWSYRQFRCVDVRWQVYMNIFLFIPFGFILPWTTRRFFFQTCLIGFVFSSCIEVTQYFFRLGLCELDDIFHNTLGTVIGYGYWKILELKRENLMESIQKIANYYTSRKQDTARTPTQQSLLNALAISLSRGDYSEDSNDDVLEEAAHQAVLPLICSGEEALQYIASNVNMLWEQSQLEIILRGIPYVILKGTCASINYPEPLRRTLGDIDILVPPEYFSAAYHAMELAGYSTNDLINGDGRHVHFHRNHILVELHRRYAVLQTKEQEELLDRWLFNEKPVEGKIGKYTFPMPQTQLNGLVLLAHINQHLEDGVGLRHLIDWCVYVQRCLPDDKWPAFQMKTDQLGLTKIAKVIARLGQTHLGLYPEITWCVDTRQETVEALLDYIFECGNFGHKDVVNNAMIMVMSHGRGVKGFFKNLQKQGMTNWRLLNEAPWLKPFAWMYQLCRYMSRGVKQGGFKHLIQNLLASKARNKLMDELGATRLALK